MRRGESARRLAERVGESSPLVDGEQKGRDILAESIAEPSVGRQIPLAQIDEGLGLVARLGDEAVAAHRGDIGCVPFEVILECVRGQADADRPGAGSWWEPASGTPSGGRGGDFLSVQVKLRGVPLDASQDRIGGAGEGEFDVLPADLGLVHRRDLAAQGRGNELRTETDADDGLACLVGLFEVRHFGLKPGVLFAFIHIGCRRRG